jgi:hypothetical protein
MERESRCGIIPTSHLSTTCERGLRATDAHFAISPTFKIGDRKTF